MYLSTDLHVSQYWPTCISVLAYMYLGTGLHVSSTGHAPPPPRFSSGGTRSVLHTDAFENLHCLVSGLKEFVLIDPDYTDIIGPEYRAQGYYDLDVDRWVMNELHVGGHGRWFDLF